MEHDKVVIKKPRTFAEEAIKKGSTYYDYENNINVIPRYLHPHPAREVSTPAKGKSAGASTPRSSSPSTSTTPKSASSRCSNPVPLT